MRRSHRGAALVLVMWLVAAMGVTVGGALTLARDEINLASARLGEARVFALAKGIVRLVLLDRANAQQTDNQKTESADEASLGIFRTQYSVDGLLVRATVYPASGFVSLGESDAEVWRQLLVGMGRMDSAAADSLAEQIVASKLRPISSAGTGPTDSFQFFSTQSQSESAAYVEQLLGVEGMNRAVYDLIRPGISPFNIASGFDLAAAPTEVAAAMGANAQQSEQAVAAGSDSSGYYCVEIETFSSSSERFMQRVWVRSHGTEDISAVRLVRVERPMLRKFDGTG